MKKITRKIKISNANYILRNCKGEKMLEKMWEKWKWIAKSERQKENVEK